MKVRLGPDLSITTTDPATGAETWHGQVPDLIHSKPEIIELLTPELVAGCAREFPELKPALTEFFPDAFPAEDEKPPVATPVQG